VIIHEELLYLMQPLAGEIVQLTNVGVHVVHFCDRDEPVIANLFLSVELLAFIRQVLCSELLRNITGIDHFPIRRHGSTADKHVPDRDG
jgi:hypothetical protein